MLNIVIPTYEMKPNGDTFLNFSLQKIYEQNYKDIEIIISDHSIDDTIKNVCDNWKSLLNIKYIKNDVNRGSSSSNLNNGIKYCSCEYVKILFQDDFLYDDNSIKNIVDYIEKNNPTWLATTTEVTIDGVNFSGKFIPKWNDRIWTGSNTLSSPSVITFRLKDYIEFDDDLIWMMDCDWYKKMYDKYGEPDILEQICVVNRNWFGRLSDTISGDRKWREVQLMYQKYNK